MELNIIWHLLISAVAMFYAVRFFQWARNGGDRIDRGVKFHHVVCLFLAVLMFVYFAIAFYGEIRMAMRCSDADVPMTKCTRSYT